MRTLYTIPHADSVKKDWNVTISVPSSELEPSYHIYKGHYEVAENIAAHGELELNRVSYIPIVSTYTGIGRVILGLNLTISGIAKGVFAVLTDNFRNGEYSMRTLKGFSFVPHGIANILRGALEVIPVVSNITMKIYDSVIPRFKYDLEYNRQMEEGEMYLIQYDNKSFWINHPFDI